MQHTTRHDLECDKCDNRDAMEIDTTHDTQVITSDTAPGHNTRHIHRHTHMTNDAEHTEQQEQDRTRSHCIIAT